MIVLLCGEDWLPLWLWSKLATLKKNNRSIIKLNTELGDVLEAPEPRLDMRMHKLLCRQSYVWFAAFLPGKLMHLVFISSKV